jgi:PAS domain S-box-containing protein
MRKTIKILLVEDNETDAELILRQVHRAGYDVKSERVESREEMMTALDMQAWDIILSDYSLPNFGGRMALEVYKERDLDIPFIVISGAIGEETALEMMKAGAHDYLMKGKLTRLVPAIEREIQETKVRHQRRVMEMELRDSEARFRTMIETAPGLLIIVDKLGNAQYASPNCEEITGFTAEDIKTDFYCLVHEQDRNRAGRFIRLTLHEELEVRNFEFQGIRKDSIVWYGSASWKPFHVARESTQGFVMQIVDITSRKQTEEELRIVNRALRVTSECNLALVRATEEDSLLRDICRVIVENGGYRFAWIGYARQDSAFTIQPKAYYGFEEGYLSKISLSWADNKYGNGPMGRSIRNKKTVFVADAQSDPEITLFKDELLQRGYRSIISIPLFFEGNAFGCLGIYSSKVDAFDPDEIALLSEMAEDLSFGIHTLRTRTERRIAGMLLEQSNAELARAYDATLEGWSRALELRERETAGHSHRVVSMTIDLSRRMGINEEDLIHIRRGSLLHDIGKMGIPDSILLKPGPLSPDEWVIMQQHPMYAFQLLSGIPYLLAALNIPYCHHERWNGSGYPRGLKGEEIPLPARIFAVVDVWDALLSDRPYRPAWPKEKVFNYLHEQAEVQFDPRVVDTFFKIWEEKNNSDPEWLNIGD